MTDDDSKLSRSDLLKAAGLAGIGLTTAHVVEANESDVEGNAFHFAQTKTSKQRSMVDVKFEPRDVVRIAIVGVGLRGTSVLNEFLAIANPQEPVIDENGKLKVLDHWPKAQYSSPLIRKVIRE